MRAIWTGAITFGLISIPVKLYSAVEEDRIHFELLDEKNGAHIKYKRVNEKTGREVDWDHIVKGYKLEKGEYVTFTHDELDELDVDTMRVIDIDTFVELSDIDPIMYDKAYYIGPQEGAEKAYKLLAKALEEQDRVGVAKFAMRQKEHLCALRARDNMLVLHTMHWPAEIRDPGEVKPSSRAQIKPREQEMAADLVDQLTGKFQPGRYRNEFEKQLRKAARAKIKGEEITRAPESQQDATVDDLMTALEASIKKARPKAKAKA